MFMGIRLGVPALLGGGFSPATLFATAGSLGFFYDFSDYTTQFTDTAGTTGVTGVGQSLALVLDEGQGLTPGPELVTNGDFSSGASWTAGTGWTIGSGVADKVAGVSANLDQALVLTSGKTYSITYTINSISVAGVFARLTGATVVDGAVRTTTGTFTELLVAPASMTTFSIRAQSTTNATIDNVSVREIPGNHATQATAGNRPLTQVRPMFTQRNRALGSELPENAVYWPTSSVQNGITATKVASGTDTDGLPYVDVRYTGTASSTFHTTTYSLDQSRTAATVGSVWLTSYVIRQIAGSTAGVTGLRAAVREETAPSTLVGITDGTPSLGATETTVSVSRTIVSGNQVSAIVSFAMVNAATIDITYRIKGLQFELGSARTTYQPAVSGERRNLLTYSQQFDNVNWGKTELVPVLADTEIAPDGTQTAETIIATAVSSQHYISSGQVTALIPDNTNFVMSCYFKPKGKTTGAFSIRLKNSTFAQVEYNLSTQALVSSSNIVSSSINAAANGFYRIEMVANSSTGAGTMFPGIGDTFSTYTGDGVSGITIWGAQLELAPTYSRYQRTITANEWYEPGFTSYRGIAFDGSDDFLQTQAINFPAAESLGPELVVNGGFDTSANWNAQAGWAVSGGGASATSVSSTAVFQISSLPQPGRLYKVTYTVSSYVSGSVRVEIRGGVTPSVSSNGTFTATISGSSGDAYIYIVGSSGFTGTIDNVSVKEVLFAADKMTVVAGVRKLSDAAALMITELGPDAATTDGSFALFQPLSTGYRARSRGTTQADATSAVFPAPETAVLTMQSDISGDSVVLRRNATQVGFAGNDQGTGNYRNDIVYIGRRGGSSLPFNGILTFLCVINRTLTAAELAQLEAFANSRTGAF